MEKVKLTQLPPLIFIKYLMTAVMPRVGQPKVQGTNWRYQNQASTEV